MQIGGCWGLGEGPGVGVAGHEDRGSLSEAMKMFWK